MASRKRKATTSSYSSGTVTEWQEKHHQEVMAEMKYLRAQSEAVDARSRYNTTCVCVIHHNLWQLIKHSEDKAHTPEYHDLPPPPPKS
ncbi:uncharacterized protein G2W53_026719 [Senna tora]|uniref:Uncharacterized protein n=1 Tax=Senna tora TaxID=362788 RepID=A0A834TPK6_9FABA|nr:uncharacterized protein G2W53_026719 [Senna tora]